MKQSTLFSMLSKSSPMVSQKNVDNTEEVKDDKQIILSQKVLKPSQEKNSQLEVKIAEKTCNDSNGKRSNLKLKKQSKKHCLGLKVPPKVAGEHVEKNDYGQCDAKELCDFDKANAKDMKINTNEPLNKIEKTQCDEARDSVSDKNVESMSYSDFLNMLSCSSQASLKVQEMSSIVKTSTEIETENNSKDDVRKNSKGNETKSDISNCKSITSYFQPSQSKSKLTSLTSNFTQKVTITAEIHHASSSTEKCVGIQEKELDDNSAKVEKLLLSESLDSSSEFVCIESKRCAKVEDKRDANNSDVIVLLSSEIIEDNALQDLKKSGKCTSLQKQREKTKFLKQSSNSNTSENATLQKQQEKTNLLKQSSKTNEGSVANKSSINSSSSSFQQSTLSFKKEGLSICTPKYTVADENASSSSKAKNLQDKSEKQPILCSETSKESPESVSDKSSTGNKSTDTYKTQGFENGNKETTKLDEATACTAM